MSSRESLVVENHLMMDLPVQMQARKKTLSSVIFSLDTAMLVILGLLFIGLNFVPPFERPFDIVDEVITHPHLPDIVPILWVLLFALIVPLLLAFAVTRDVVETVDFYIEYGLGMAITLVITEFFKVSVGRLRPDFISRCKPVDSVCTGIAKEIREGRKSFFSGHASSSFYCISHMVFWMLKHGWNKLGFRVSKRQTNIVVLVGSLLPFGFCSFVAVSRSQQFIHHPSDIFIGSLVGILVAYWFLKYHKN
jgi:membrane-associated phospholipid phosphatase